MFGFVSATDVNYAYSDLLQVLTKPYIHGIGYAGPLPTGWTYYLGDINQRTT